jgi:hypothetical protein
MTKLTTEQWFGQLQGTMDTVLYTVGELIARHPEKTSIMGTLGGLADKLKAPGNPPTFEDARALGVARSIQQIAAAVQVFEAAKEIREGTGGPQH